MTIHKVTYQTTNTITNTNNHTHTHTHTHTTNQQYFFKAAQNGQGTDM